MALTAKQVYDLNNSMSAAQNVNLGTLISSLTDAMVASGNTVPSDAVIYVDTGLSVVSGATVALSGSPTLNHMWSTVTPTSGSAGYITITSYKPTAAGTATPILATGSYVEVSWIATGIA